MEVGPAAVPWSRASQPCLSLRYRCPLQGSGLEQPQVPGLREHCQAPACTHIRVRDREASAADRAGSSIRTPKPSLRVGPGHSGPSSLRGHRGLGSAPPGGTSPLRGQPPAGTAAPPGKPLAPRCREWPLRVATPGAVARLGGAGGGGKRRGASSALVGGASQARHFAAEGERAEEGRAELRCQAATATASPCTRDTSAAPPGLPREQPRRSLQGPPQPHWAAAELLWGGAAPPRHQRRWGRAVPWGSGISAGSWLGGVVLVS